MKAAAVQLVFLTLVALQALSWPGQTGSSRSSVKAKAAGEDPTKKAASPKPSGQASKSPATPAKNKATPTAVAPNKPAGARSGARRPEKATFEPPMEFKGTRMVRVGGPKPKTSPPIPGTNIVLETVSPETTFEARHVLRIPDFDTKGSFSPRETPLDRPYLQVPIVPLKDDAGGGGLPESVQSMFTSPDGFTRAAACWIAGEYRDASVVDFVSLRLSDSEDRVQRFAAQALGLIGGPKAIQALQQFLTRAKVIPKMWNDSSQDHYDDDWSREQSTVSAAKDGLRRAAGDDAFNAFITELTKPASER